MKRVFTFLMVLFFFNLNAQEFHFIPKIGINLSRISNVEEGDMKTGLNVGWAGELKLSKKFALESGFMYSMQGNKMEDGDSDIIKGE